MMASILAGMPVLDSTKRMFYDRYIPVFNIQREVFGMAYEAKYTLRVLVNDWVREKPWELEGEHGLSFFIETPQSKFLFDCGHTGAAWLA